MNKLNGATKQENGIALQLNTEKENQKPVLQNCHRRKSVLCTLHASVV